MNKLSNHTWPDPHKTDSAEREYLDMALRSSDWSHTELCKEFERNFAEFVGAAHALMVPSGTAAIYLALVVAGIRPGQEVIIPGVTWPSVVYAILKAGGIPLTVDISPTSFCMNLDAVKEAKSDRTFAILATHLFGSQCDMQEICEYAESQNVIVIEDSAQSIGSVQSNKYCGTWGVAGVFSFNDKKVLACGEGGCIATDSQTLFDEMKRIQLILPDRGSRPRTLPGTYKVSEFQAAVALGQLEKLEARLVLMNDRANFLTSLLQHEGRGRISIQTQPESVEFQSYYNYCFLIHDNIDATRFRKRLSNKLNLKISGPYKPLSDITDFEPQTLELPAEASNNLGVRHENCLTAYAHTCMRVPHFALLSDEPVLEILANTIIETLDDE